jgi:hypothetical protein
MAVAILITTIWDLQREFKRSEWSKWEQMDERSYWRPQTFTEK